MPAALRCSAQRPLPPGLHASLSGPHPYCTRAMHAASRAQHPTAAPRWMLQVMRTAGAGEQGLTFPAYRAALEGLDVDLHVEVPDDD